MDLRKHHAYVVEGRWDVVGKPLQDLIGESFGVETYGNPDFWCEQGETFGIDEARRLADMQLRKAVGKRSKIFIMGFDTATTEAQNALLKVLEEPTPNTHFFLVTSFWEALLPTLRSRVEKLSVSTESKQKPDIKKKAEEFLKKDVNTRLRLIQNIIEEKNISQAKVFVEALEECVYKQFAGARSVPAREAFALLSTARRDLSVRAPSVKLILEHVAVTLPRS